MDPCRSSRRCWRLRTVLTTWFRCAQCLRYPGALNFLAVGASHACSQQAGVTLMAQRGRPRPCLPRGPTRRPHPPTLQQRTHPSSLPPPFDPCSAGADCHHQDGAAAGGGDQQPRLHGMRARGRRLPHGRELDRVCGALCMLRPPPLVVMHACGLSLLMCWLVLRRAPRSLCSVEWNSLKLHPRPSPHPVLPPPSSHPTGRDRRLRAHPAVS